MRGRFGVVLCVLAGLGGTATIAAAQPAEPAQILGLPLPFPTIFPGPNPTATPTPVAATPTPTPAATVVDVPVEIPTRAPSATPTPDPTRPPTRDPGEPDTAGPLLASHTRGFVRGGRRLLVTLAATERCRVRLQIAAATKTGQAATFTLPEGKPVKVRLKVPRKARPPLRLVGSATDRFGNAAPIDRPIRDDARRY